MYEVTDEWIERINDEFREKDIPHKQRPWLAWSEWSKHIGLSTSFDDEDVKKIFEWFEKNTQAGSQHIGPIYTGAFYYDSCFWPVFIPVVFGSVQLNLRDSLKTMPNGIRSRLWGNRDEVMNYAAFWAACLDYGLGIDGLTEDTGQPVFARELIRSGDQQLTATATLLLEKRPNPKAVESGRMATEMFLKAFLASRGGLSEEKARSEIGHNLQVALNRCLALDPQSELRAILPELTHFPSLGDRYKGTERPVKELWKAYGVAQFSGTALVRTLTGRDCRKTMRLQ